MTIDETKAKRRAMETEIARVIQSFEESTGMTVRTIDLRRERPGAPMLTTVEPIADVVLRRE